MRILVLSDTHVPVVAKTLPPIIEEEARKCDCCLHSGDFISYSVFETLNALTTTYGVYGNMDDTVVRKKLPSKQILQFEGIVLGLIHGSGHPAYLIDCVQKEFVQQHDKISLFIFGHSHQPIDKLIDGKIYFNPGSPTDTVFAPYRSYGILQIEGTQLKRRIIKIE